MIKLGILISGRGSNMAAILAAISSGELQAEAVLVVSNKKTAPGLAYAEAHGVPTLVLEPASFDSDAAYNMAIVEALKAAGVEWVVLAGYMKIVGAALLTAFANRMINIHPSLLPDFKGLHAQQQALDAGVTVAGCTTHFVTEELDGGQIILQSSVPVLPEDTVLSLSDRILQEEHPLLVKTLQLASAGKI